MYSFLLTGNAMFFSTLVSAAIVLYLLSRQYKIGNAGEGIRVGAVWLVIDALLEYCIIVQPFSRSNFSFYTWAVLLRYLLIIVIPAAVGASVEKR
ncbi:hypothetical protein HZB08_00925 [Candidatus Saganbacteria bacterium]|uniref:Uncharacterized protein n=1 Tax=Candidatus Saganbacteria bacterium TaxID=2575572 RepID=A0A9D6YVP6_UNCSA|nr:hypothetical protein [Candidatus Saganbacteria bacterium]